MDNKIKILVQSLVVEELKKVLPIIRKQIRASIKKEVKNMVNEVLADKMIGLIQEGGAPKTNRKNLSSTMNVLPEPAMSKPRSQNSEAVRKSLESRILMEDPMIASIYGDIVEESANPSANYGTLPPGVIPPSGQNTDLGYEDSPDAGVDLSIFNL